MATPTETSMDVVPATTRTQAIPTAPVTPTRKRIRVHSNEGDDNEQEVRLIALLSPGGTTTKRIVMNPARYIAQREDMVADTWVTNETYRRMYEFIMYDNPAGVWFPLDKKPTEASWTALTDNSDTYTQLSIHGRRLLFLTVGAIHGSTIATRPNELSPRLRIQLKLLREADRAAAADIFNSGNTHGKVTATGMSVLSASTRADTGVGIPPYKRVYDATTAYTKKSAMERVDPHDLLPGDIAMIEVYIVRTEEQSGSSAAFHINAVNVLSWGPRPPRAPEADEETEPEFPDTI